MAATVLQLPCSSGAAISERAARANKVCFSLKVSSNAEGQWPQPEKSRRDRNRHAECVEVRHRGNRHNHLAASALLGLSGPLLLTHADIAMAAEAAEQAGYSQGSYYASLGLFVLALPGVWSFIKRSTKSKIVKKTYEVPGPASEDGKPPQRLAGEILSFFTRNNFNVKELGEVIKFEGLIAPSRGQAGLIVFCTLLCLASVALVLTIAAPAFGVNWYWITALSPLSGVYYWTKAARKEEIQVKLTVAEDSKSMDVIILGDEEQIDSFRRELGLREKGMIYVKGLLEK